MYPSGTWKQLCPLNSLEKQRVRVEYAPSRTLAYLISLSLKVVAIAGS
jgi:hypothetical protein